MPHPVRGSVSRGCHEAPVIDRIDPAPPGTARAADLRERHGSTHGSTVPPARRIAHDPRPDSDDKVASCNTGGSRRWACSRSARRRPTRRDAVARKPCHHQGVPLAGRLVPVPGVDGAFVAVVPHGHPTRPSRVGSGRAHDHATTLGERSSEGVRVSAHATSRHGVSVPHTRTGVRESGWHLARPGAAGESQGSPTANRCVAPAVGLRQHRSVLCAWAAGFRSSDELSLRRHRGHPRPLSPGPSPAELARVLAIGAGHAEPARKPTKSLRRFP